MLLTLKMGYLTLLFKIEHYITAQYLVQSMRIKLFKAKDVLQLLCINYCVLF